MKLQAAENALILCKRYGVSPLGNSHAKLVENSTRYRGGFLFIGKHSLNLELLSLATQQCDQAIRIGVQQHRNLAETFNRYVLCQGQEFEDNFFVNPITAEKSIQIALELYAGTPYRQ